MAHSHACGASMQANQGSISSLVGDNSREQGVTCPGNKRLSISTHEQQQQHNKDIRNGSETATTYVT
jgi:hypothetical protein